MREVRIVETAYNGWGWETEKDRKYGFESSEDAFDDWHFQEFERQ